MTHFRVELGNGPRTGMLLVEDDANDQRLFCLAAKQTGLSLSIQTVGDGEQAIEHLEGRSPSGEPQRFEALELVVLDLNMPVMDGFEFLRWLKSSPAWRHLPAVVLTGIAEGEWREQAMGLGALSCWEKPLELEGWVRVLRQAWATSQVHRRAEKPRHRIVPGGHRLAWLADGRGAPWVPHPAQTPYSE